jgi:hypothetical protein
VGLSATAVFRFLPKLSTGSVSPRCRSFPFSVRSVCKTGSAAQRSPPRTGQVTSAAAIGTLPSLWISIGPGPLRRFRIGD